MHPEQQHLFLDWGSRSSVADGLRPRLIDISIKELKLKASSKGGAGLSLEEVEI